MKRDILKKLEDIERLIGLGDLRRIALKLSSVVNNHFANRKQVVQGLVSQINDFFDKRDNKLARTDDLDVTRNQILRSIGNFVTMLMDLETSYESSKPGEKEVSALRLFDFSAQIISFQNNRRLRNSLFLIHGEGDCGQKWLYNRIIKLKNCRVSRKPVPISLGSAGALIEDCIYRLGEEYAPSEFKLEKIIPKVIEIIKEKLCHEDVILIFERTDFDPDQLQLFYEKIWQPLKEASEASTSYQLVGFFVEYKLMSDLESAFNQPQYQELVGFPKIQEVDERAIAAWRYDCGRMEEHNWILEEFFEKDETLCHQMLAVSKAPWRFMQRVCKHMNKDINLLEWLEH